jgi:hypothetical protein
MGHLYLAAKRVMALVGILYFMGLPSPGMHPQSRQTMGIPGMPGSPVDSPWTMSGFDMQQNATLLAHEKIMDKMETHIDKTDERVENIGRELSDQEGSTRIVDWGLATAVGAAMTISLTNLFMRIRKP